MKRGLDIQIGLVGSALGLLFGSAVGGIGDPEGPRSTPIRTLFAETRPDDTVVEAETFRVTYGLEELTDEIVSSPVTGYPEFNAAVDEWVYYWTSTASGWLQGSLVRMGWFAETVDREIALRELPASLRYLPVVESGYSPRALSRASAVGMWQFMAETAEGFGLEINAHVDERRDPFKSTHAALTFLQQLHDEYGSWFFALAAYNCGPARVEQILNRYASGQVPSDSLFWALRSHFPVETQEFVPKLFGAIVVAGNPVAHGYEEVLARPFRFDRVRVPDPATLSVVAAAAEVDEAEIARLNPEWVQAVAPPERAVRIPKGKVRSFRLNYTRISTSERTASLEAVVATYASGLETPSGSR